MEKIVFDGEGKGVDAAAAVVVVERAAVIVMMMIGKGGVGPGIGAAFLLGFAASRAGDFVGGDDTGVEPGEDAEEQKPCEEVPHVWVPSSFAGGGFQGKSMIQVSCGCKRESLGWRAR
jgi:hypothetical protein